MDEHYAKGGPIHVLPEPMRVGMMWPSKPMRVLLTIREVALIAWLLTGTVVMVLMLAGLGSFLNELSKASDEPPAPEPAVTGCPFGEVECGG